NMSVPRLLVESALRPDTSVSRADIQELITTLFGLSQQISAVGLNLNQIAKVANASGEVPDDLHNVFQGLKQLYFKTEQAIDEVASVQGEYLLFRILFVVIAWWGWCHILLAQVGPMSTLTRMWWLVQLG